MNDSHLTVGKWMNLTEEEFKQKVKWGICIKCGKSAKYFEEVVNELLSYSLCKIHEKEFLEWQKQKIQNEIKKVYIITTNWEEGTTIIGASLSLKIAKEIGEEEVRNPTEGKWVEIEEWELNGKMTMKYEYNTFTDGGIPRGWIIDSYWQKYGND